MSREATNWLRTERLQDVFCLVAFIVSIIVIMNVSPSVLKVEPVVAQVKKVEGKAPFQVQLILPSGQTTHLLIPPPKPRVGEVLPLRAEHYENGDVLYSLDHERRLIALSKQ